MTATLEKVTQQGWHALTLDNFSQTVMQAEIAVVYFSAPWCQPCHQVRPAVQAFAQQHPELAYYGEVDVSASSAISQRYGIRSVPVIVVCKQGSVVAQLPGQVAVLPELARLLHEQRHTL
ncbi:thioredoxin family protein [Paenalcaligenes sp. Me131]|uniref:thioredoxin family protein n=1 Tax=Paenalcaligenes sp. Me131 TaxID=3392636 RepID=UPI003D2D8F19